MIHIYNHINPFLKSELLYFAGFIGLIISLFFSKRVLKKTSLFLTISGLIINIAGIVMLAIIRKNIPATTMFEILALMACTSVITGLIINFIYKIPLGLYISSILGFIFLFLSNHIVSHNNITKEIPLILNSKLGLFFHVVTIIIGYTGTISAGITAHFYFFSKKSNNTFKTVHTLQIIGLLFVYIGTVLGGVWAQNAWGSFWDFDPKENGALLIIILNVITFLLYHTKKIDNKKFCIFSISSLILVFVEWFGINMLNVGHHSYGHTPYMLIPLLAYIVLELLFIFFIVRKSFTQPKKQ